MKLIGFIVLVGVLAFAAWQMINMGSDSNTEARYSESSGDVSEEKVEVYDGIAVAKSTRYLILSGRNLEGSLKAEVRQLNQLEVLDMSNNNLTGVPAEVGQLTELRVLNLSNNPITGLPQEIGNLQNLETLNLSGTNYAAADLEIIKSNLPADVEIIIN